MKPLSLLSAAVCVLFFSISGSAATFNVNVPVDTQDVNPGDGICADASNNCSVRAAITEANAVAGEDVINIPPGNFTQTLSAPNEDSNAGGDWDITSNIVINGLRVDNPSDPHPLVVYLQAATMPNTASERVFHIVGTTPVVTINKLIIRYGKTGSGSSEMIRGGGINNAGNLTLNSTTVMENYTGEGGGIFNSGTIALIDSQLLFNTCANGGVFCYGGGMYSLHTPTASGTVTIRNTSFQSNDSTAPGPSGSGLGGGLAVNASAPTTITITDSSFVENEVSGGGGAGSVSNGAGLRVQAAAATPVFVNITNTRFQLNKGVGGPNMSGIGISLLTGASAGSIDATFDRLIVHNNSAPGAKGVGLSAGSSAGSMTLRVRNSTFSNNSGGAEGGAVYLANANNAQATVEATFTNSTFSGNSVSDIGGAFRSVQGAPATVLTRCMYCTITGNTAANGGGGIVSPNGSGTHDISNSVIAGNTSATGADILGAVTSNGYNHIGSLVGAIINGSTTGNTIGDALLGPLANNGGPTQTHRPNTGSILINAIPFGQNGCGAPDHNTDQRGLPRPNGGAGNSCDKGSVEVNPGPFTISGTVRTEGGLPIRNAIVIISGGNLPGPLFYPTATFGVYEFPNLAPGEYIVSVSSKRYSFDGRTVNLQQNENAINFNGRVESRGVRDVQFEIIPASPVKKR